MPRSKKTIPSASSKSKAFLWGMALLLVTLAALGIWAWRSGARGPGTDPANRSSMGPQARQQTNDSLLFLEYGRSQSCRECHPAAFDLWKGSHHALAERRFDKALDQPAFDPPRAIRHGTQTSEARMTNGNFELIADSAPGLRKAFFLDRVIGVAPLRQFLVPGPGGRVQTTELAIDPATNEWFDIFGEENRLPGEWGHWSGRGMTWNSMCAACHNTRVRKNYAAATDTYNTTMAEMSVSCEACHGPLAKHALWQRQNPRRPGDPTLRKLDPGEMLGTCGSCHSRRAELTGDFKPGDSFFDHYSLTIPDETDIYYPDGQVRDEDYEFASFLGSKMFAAGVRCSDCHNSHSGKVHALDNGLCLRCHTAPVPPAPKIEPSSHSHHSLDKPGGQCVDCHMPQTTYMQRHARRDHGFTIPDPLLTKEHGIPNACNRCHTDRSVDWALENVEKWYGPRMDRPTRERARWIAEARAGKPTAHLNLLKMLSEEKIPLWRAVAAGLLERWSPNPSVAAALLKAASDPEPLVRTTAAHALESLGSPISDSVLRSLLNDPVRAVRVGAAWALRSQLETNSAAGQDLLRYLEHNRDQPAGLLQLGTWHVSRGETAMALEHFQKAIEWDKNSAPLYHALAVASSLAGKTAEAVQALETACRLAPREAEYQYKLGLALNEAGRLAEATGALEQAVKLDPQFAQAWYNLGLAYSRHGQEDRALEVLARAETLDATAARIPYARATIFARLGQTAEARTCARRTLELDPNHSDAAELLQLLGSTSPR